MKKINKTIEPSTWGDFKASAVLAKIAQEYKDAENDIGMKYCRKAFHFISKNIDACNELKDINKSGLRTEIYNAFFNNRIKPHVEAIEHLGYKNISTHAFSIMKSHRRIYITRVSQKTNATKQ